MIVRSASFVVTLALGLAGVGAAATPPLSTLGGFQIGSAAGIQCSAQSRPNDAVAIGMFDRVYALNCRDAVAPPGKLYVLKASGNPVARLTAARARVARCAAEHRVDLPGLAGTTEALCTLETGVIPYSVYTVTSGPRLYVAEGLAGYDDALRLALRSLVADRIVTGTIGATVTAAGDAAAFARAQAGSLDPALALGEAYRRNNGGSYAEASEFFAVLTTNEAAKGQRDEFLLGAALQQSNLGAFAEADTLFARVSPDVVQDPVGMRLSRNFHAIHWLNQRRPEDALAELDRRMAPAAPATVPGPPVIDALAAARLNRDATLATVGGIGLTSEERAQLLDAQALQLRGAALRLGGDTAGARVAVKAAVTALSDIGRRGTASVARLKSAAYADVAGLDETSGDLNAAEGQLRLAITTVAAEYPDSLATLSLEARLAALLARRGKVEAALTLYRTVVTRAVASGTVGPGLLGGLAPYYALLARESVAHPELAGDFFTASQLLLRPGVAQTQAVLARELSGGDDEAARLFRQSTALTRDIDRTRIEIGRLGAQATLTTDETTRLAGLRTRFAQLATDQTATTAELGKYPRFRAVATTGLTLADLQAALKPGEAYFKLTAPGTRAYGMLVTPTAVRLYPIAPTVAALGRKVGRLRQSIVVIEDGAPSTKPYDVALAYELFTDIAGPIAEDLRAVRHVIYEPDGPLLKLPLAPLVMGRAGVDAYAARQQLPGADPFDFRGVAWVGRALDISTSVSPLAFRDLRNAAASRATKSYIGFGQNAPLAGFALTQATTRGVVGSGPGCTWSPAEWSHPVPGAELYQAATLLGGVGTAVVTGAAFTDTDITSRTDLAQYRILHFATHGLVTAPKPECPARPALMTSFGGPNSDGLLTFAKVFDLHLDADLIILSACDTAGSASVGASREAGVTTGGDFALDGLVRAFVGAGGRVVIASHWPVPDEFNATQRLIGGLFTAPPGTSIAGALHAAQLPLMDAAATSHPYYWAAFSVVGDGGRPIMRQIAGGVTQTATSDPAARAH